MATDNKALGIDLGTTYCCVSVYSSDRVEVTTNYQGNTTVYSSNRVEIITNDQGNRTTPSMVAFNDTERLVGDGAKNQLGVNPNNTVYDVKRLMGRSFSDSHVQKDKQLWPFTVEEGSQGSPVIRICYKGESQTLAPEQISGLLLGKMKQIAEKFLGSDVKKAVVTVPAYFNDTQRQATKIAAKFAGLDLLQLLNEPNAAAIAYGLDSGTYSSDNGKTILVFDLGGGTFDVSIVTIVRGKFNVKALDGDTHLGGTDFDERMVNHFVQEFQRKYKVDISKEKRALQKLRNACERAKRALSEATIADIQIDALYDGIDFCSKISRAKFEDLNYDLFSKCLDGVKQCLQTAGIAKEGIDEVVLVGGSTRILKLQQMLQQFFADRKLCRSINPDEAVAYGAAVQAAVLTGQCSDVILSDVTPLSLGIESDVNMMSIIIPKSSRIPVKRVGNFLTSVDNQTSVPICIYEGERTVAADNNLLGSFRLSGIPADLRGKEKLEVCFEIDGNGILKVSAENQTAGSKSIIISNKSCRLSEDEINRMMFDARRFQAEDERALRKHKARSGLENHAYEARNSARDERCRGTIADGRADKIEKVTSEAIEWIENNHDADIADFEIKLRDLKLDLA